MTWPPLSNLGLIFAAVALAGFIRGLTGFGAGLVLAPALTILLPPAVGVPIMVLLEIGASIRLVPQALENTRWKTVLPIGLGAAVTLPFGGWFLAHMDPQEVRRWISLLVFCSVVLLASGWRYRGRLTAPMAWLVGNISGVMTGIAGVGGPPVVVVLLAGKDSGSRTRANLISFFAISQTVAALVFWYQGLITLNVIILTVVFGIVFVAFITLGARYFGRIPEKIHRRWTLAILFIIAVAGLYASWQSTT